MSIILENNRLNAKTVNRERLILDFCKNKIVIHLGCVDYPYLIEQYKSGNLLHEKICKVAKKTFGVDLNKEGIDFLKSLGYQDLFVCSVEALSKISFEDKYEVIVAGELIEHLSNPGLFFENVSSLMDDNTVLIITVPNAFSVKNFLRVLMRHELIHPDHVCYFSPSTIKHFCSRYNLELKEYYYYLLSPRGFFKKIIFLPLKYLIKFFIPYISDGLIFIVVKRKI